MGDLARDVVSEWERLKGDRSVFETHWQQIANYMLPNRNDYLGEKSPGQKRMTYIFDASPVWALEQLAAGLHSLLTSTSLQWFYLNADDDRINSDDEVRAWLQDAGERMYAIFNGPRHNFASQSHELYLDLGSIGTASMAVLDSVRSGILFSTRHMRECCLKENEEDRIDTNIRDWKWTAKQAFQQWGAAAGEKVMKAMSDGKDSQRFEFVHGVRPRLKRDVQRADKMNMAWESVYVSLADMTEIAVAGFNEFPYLCPRFSKVSGETYGRGPGAIALPDVQMLNEMKKLVIKAAQKIIDPPLQIPDDGFLVNIKTVPGSMNYYRAGTTGRIEAIKTEGNIPIGIEMINQLQQQILREFYVEWLMMPSDPRDPAAAGKGVTATYVLQQRDEKMRLLSPMLARMQSEFLGPLIDRVFAMLWRKSKAMRFGPGAPFAPPPQKLSGMPLRVEYVSPIALAQKSTQMDGVARLIELQMQLRQIDNQMPVVLDGEEILRIAGRDYNAPASALRSSENLQAEAQAKAEAESAMQNHMAISNLAGAAKDGTAALKNVAAAGGMKEAA